MKARKVKSHLYVAEEQKPMQGSARKRNGQNEKEKMILADVFWMDGKGDKCEWRKRWHSSWWKVTGALAQVLALGMNKKGLIQ